LTKKWNKIPFDVKVIFEAKYRSNSMGMSIINLMSQADHRPWFQKRSELKIAGRIVLGENRNGKTSIAKSQEQSEAG